MSIEALTQFKKVVALGGGHGMGRVLSALSFLGPRLTGIVTTTDNGGSTGRLRKSQSCIAWGDLRNCLNQLVTTPGTGSLLFEYRFTGNGELAGHNLGNLMLLALDNLCVRPLDAIELISDMLHIEPRLLPMSEHPTDLCARTPCGSHIIGEVSVDQLETPPHSLFLHPPVPAIREALDAVEQADLILLGPGSFFTSIMPPLLMPELARAIEQSRAPLVFITNLVNEAGPAGHLSLEAQCHWLESLLGSGRLDAVLAPPGSRRGDWPGTVIETELGEAGLPHRHDREKLKDALEQWLQIPPSGHQL
ncbi:gluconeogenesis factor YvcK family protein [Aeromonas schubertii]